MPPGEAVTISRLLPGDLTMIKMSQANVGRWRDPLAALLVVGVVSVSMGLPAMAEQTATFAGGLLDPDGKPAAGFHVVMRDVVSGKMYTSAVSDASGQYTMSVPVGGRYKLEGVLAPDGTRLPVQDGPPLSVRSAGNNRLDVRFTAAATSPRMAPEPAKPAPAAPKAPATSTTKAPERTPPARIETKKPWWKTSGGVIGIVAGVAVVAAVASGVGDNASPSQP